MNILKILMKFLIVLLILRRMNLQLDLFFHFVWISSIIRSKENFDNEIIAFYGYFKVLYSISKYIRQRKQSLITYTLFSLNFELSLTWLDQHYVFHIMFYKLYMLYKKYLYTKWYTRKNVMYERKKIWNYQSVPISVVYETSIFLFSIYPRIGY